MEPSSIWIKPNPDIAGIGVIVSFVVMGSFIMILRVFALWHSERGFFKLRTFFWPPEDLDMYMDGTLSQLDVIDNTLASFTLAQSVTGMAIATAALLNDEITAYHFYLCEEMAWMALIASTIDLITARRENAIAMARRRDGSTVAASTVKKVVRVAVLWVLLGLILWMAALRNDFIDWNEKMYQYEPAWDTKNLRVVAGIIFLAYNSVSAIVDTAATIPDWGPWVLSKLGFLVRLPLLQFKELPVQFGEWFTAQDSPLYNIFVAGINLAASIILPILAIPILLVLYLISLSLYWWTLQPVAAYVVNLAFFIWGVCEVFQYRRNGRGYMLPSDQDEEDTIGFGQTVALMLLVSPIIANVDLWYGSLLEKFVDNHRQRQRRRPPYQAPVSDSLPHSSGDSADRLVSSGAVPTNEAS